MWKPGPYPINDEERVAAAKKYGMLLEDYKPNEDMDAMMGDYPNLPVEPQAEKNALYEWDCPEYRRNYGEPLQEEWWKYQEIRFSPMRRKKIPSEILKCARRVEGCYNYYLHFQNGGGLRGRCTPLSSKLFWLSALRILSRMENMGSQGESLFFFGSDYHHFLSD